MSYFIPRPRSLRILNGAIETVIWPTQAIIQVVLSPEELFGPAKINQPRTLLVGGAPIPIDSSVLSGIL